MSSLTKDLDQHIYRATLGADQDEIIVGDESNPNNFKPKLRLTRWNKEASLTIRYDKVFADDPVFEEDADYEKDKVSVKNIVNEFYVCPVSEDVLKFGLILRVKPATNSFTFKLEGWQDFDFFYQLPLANTNKDGSTWEETEGGISTRPADINGSYAIYHKTKKNHIIGQTNYKTGKFGHIFRPKFIDAEDNWIWGSINIENGNYTVTIPQDFLDNAVYPVKANDTFGDTGIGASTVNWAQNNQARANVLAATLHTAVTGDTITSFSHYGSKSGAGTLTMAAYSVTSDLPNVRLGTPVSITLPDTTPDWANSGAVSQAMTNGVVYCLAVGGFSSATMTSYYDTITNGRSGDTSTTLPATWTHAQYGAAQFSMYATYTAGTTTTKPKRRVILTSCS
jgi:hypothetical protein